MGIGILRRPAIVGCLVAGALLALPGAARAQIYGERIASEDVRIDIQPDGSIIVTERIDYDFAQNEHHGIFRDIPVRFSYDSRYDRVYPLHVISVEASPPGTSDRFTTEKSGNLFRIKIGDPDRTITGLHSYTITYRVEGALNAFSDHDELYWNATGNEWDVPIDRASVTVTGPVDLLRSACYAGPRGSSLPCFSHAVDGHTATFGQSSLAPFDGVTVVVGFPTGVVPRPHPILQERWALQRAFSLTPVTAGTGGALLLLLLIILGRLMWMTGRDRRAVGSAVDVAFGSEEGGEQAVPLFERSAGPVEYAPPDDVRPGQVGTLMDEVANPLDVTATVVDLAVRGYLRIEEIPKEGWFGKPDWKLVKLKEPDEGLLKYERLLLDGLFEGAPEPGEEGLGAEGRFRSVKVSSLKRRFAARLRKVEDALYADAAERRWFAGRPDTVRQAWSKRGVWVLIAGAVLTWLAAAKTHLGLIPLPIAVAGLILMWGAHLMPRRTSKGTGLVRRILGFRTYIATAEKDEARFAERENLFSKYLPYAIVFGCTEQWARRFAGLADQAPSVPWYVGSGPFTLGAFSSAMDGFTISTAGTIASTPSSSGGSGFGGGGFSGGGGGGGGGGSW